MDKFYEGPPRCLVYPKLWLTLGDSATGNEVDDDGEGIRGNDNDNNNNGNHDGDSEGNGEARWAVSRRDTTTMVMTMKMGETIMTRQRQWERRIRRDIMHI